MHARVQTERARMMIQSGRRESRDYVRGEVEPETSVVWNVRSVSRIGRCYLVSTLRNIPVGDRHRGVWPPYVKSVTIGKLPWRQIDVRLVTFYVQGKTRQTCSDF
jgi:hypothetical protein